jgi:integrase
MVRYRILLQNQIGPTLGAITLEKLRPLDLDAAYSTWRRSGNRRGGALSERTVLHLHRLLHRALSQAVRWGLATRNVADAVDAPRPVRREMAALGETQVQKMLAEAKKRSRYEAIFGFLLWTGARRGEALALRWDDVDSIGPSLSSGGRWRRHRTGLSSSRRSRVSRAPSRSQQDWSTYCGPTARLRPSCGSSPARSTATKGWCSPRTTAR